MTPPTEVESRKHRERHSREPSHDDILASRQVGDMVRVGLLAMILVVPWAIGGVWPGTLQLLFAAVTVALLAWLVSYVMGRDPSFHLPLAAVPLILAIAWGAAQLIPLPDGVAHGALQDQFRQGDPTATWPVCTSLYPSATRRDLSALILALAIFVLAARYFSNRRALLWMAIALAGNGAALAFFGLVQQLRSNGKLFWIIELTQGGEPFSSFVNRNNAGGYLNMCLAGALGFLLWSIDRVGYPPETIPIPELPPWRNKLIALAERMRWRTGQVDGPQVVALVLGALIVTGVLCTLSRGAFVSMVVASAVTMLAALVHRKRVTTTWLAGLITLLAIGLVGWIARTDVVNVRLATLLQYPEHEGRIPHWGVGLQAAADNWLTGSGLGTYRYIYRLYDNELHMYWFHHAENQYIEALVVAGLPGLLLLLAAIVLSAAAMLHLLNRSGTKEHGLVLMGIFALTSQVVQSLFDFGLFLPANMVLLAAICGAIVGRSSLEPKHHHRRRRAERFAADRESPGKWRSTLVVLPALLALVAYGDYAAWKQDRVAAALVNSQRAGDEQRNDVIWLDDAIGKLSAAVNREAGNAAAQAELAELYLLRYGRGAPEWLKAKVPDIDKVFDNAALANVATLNLLDHAAKNRGPVSRQELSAWMAEPLAKDNLLPAVEHLEQARAGCPLLPNVYVRLAELSFVNGTQDREEALLEHARRLNPGDASLLFRSGRVHLYAGRQDKAWANWQRALALGADEEPRIFQFLVNQFSTQPTREEATRVLEKVLPNDPELLLRAAQKYFKGPQFAEVRSWMVDRAKQVRDSQVQPAANLYYLGGQLDEMDGNIQSAITSYRKAIDLEPTNHRWRADFARFLLKQALQIKLLATGPDEKPPTKEQLDQRQEWLDEARKHARYCIRSEKDNPALNQLVTQINDALLGAELQD